MRPTTPPEPEPAGQGAEPQAEEPAAAARGAKARKRKAPASDKAEGVKLYLTEDVRFRLRMLSYKRGVKLSTAANEVLDRALPKWTLERTE